MKCKNCNNEMILDDVDLLPHKVKEKYWLCEKCEISCIEYTKDGKTLSVDWNEG